MKKIILEKESISTRKGICRQLISIYAKLMAYNILTVLISCNNRGDCNVNK